MKASDSCKIQVLIVLHALYRLCGIVQLEGDNLIHLLIYQRQAPGHQDYFGFHVTYLRFAILF